MRGEGETVDQEERSSTKKYGIKMNSDNNRNPCRKFIPYHLQGST